MPQITLNYFASLREKRGLDKETLQVSEGSTVSEVLRNLCPDLGAERDGVAFACNHRVVSGDTVVQDGDLVVFLPPFGGG